MDPSVAEAALGEANLAVLVSAIAHLTGDLTLVDRYREPGLFDHGRESRPAVRDRQAEFALQVCERQIIEKDMARFQTSLLRHDDEMTFNLIARPQHIAAAEQARTINWQAVTSPTVQARFEKVVNGFIALSGPSRGTVSSSLGSSTSALRSTIEQLPIEAIPVLIKGIIARDRCGVGFC